MAAIQHTLQHEIFTPSDEKLLSACSVTDLTDGKGKASHLCLATSTDDPTNGSSLMLYQVEKNDKNLYEKTQTWPLTDIQIVDGINDLWDLELHINKVNKWFVLSERQAFISNLYLHSCALPQKPEFKNIPRDWLVNPDGEKESDWDRLPPGSKEQCAKLDELFGDTDGSSVSAFLVSKWAKPQWKKMVKERQQREANKKATKGKQQQQ